MNYDQGYDDGYRAGMQKMREVGQQRIEELEAKLAKAVEALEKIAGYDPDGCNLDQSWASDALAEIDEMIEGKNK